MERRWQPATIQDRNGEDLVSANARVWRTTSQTTAGGQRYDYQGVCDARARDSLIGKQNRLLRFEDGRTYRVVDAIFYFALDYVAVNCVEVVDGK